MSICAIDRLSDEILCEIFYALRDSWDVLYSYDESLQGKWVVVTWVCHRWREVALDNRNLLTKLYIWNPACLLESMRVILDRAPPTAGLEILVYPDADGIYGTPVDLCASLFEHLGTWSHRIEVLYVPCLTKWFDTIEAFVCTLTRLKMLTFAGSELCGDLLSPLINLQGLPDLHNLRLYQMVFRPHREDAVLLAPNITHLEITGCRSQYPHDLPDFLLLCPNVENLILDGALSGLLQDEEDGWEDMGVSFMTFPRMKFFRMQNEITRDSPLIIHNMSLPPSASFELDLEEGGSNPDNGDLPFITRTDAWLRHHVLPEDLGDFPVLASTHTLTVRLVRAWEIPHSGIEPAQTGVRFGVHGMAGTRGSDQRHWSINVSCADFEHLRSPSLYCERFFRGFPLIVAPDHIVRLDLHIGRLFPVHRSGLWRNLFEDFPAVQALCLGGWATVRGVLGTLDKYPYLLPELQELDLCINTVPPSIQGDVTTVIIEWLTMRGEIDAPLQKVMLQLTTGAQSDLRAYVHLLASRIRERHPEMEVSEVTQGSSCTTCEEPGMEITRDWGLAETEEPERSEADEDAEWSDYSTDSEE